MNDSWSHFGTAILAFFKLTGLKVIVGIIGTALLYLALPPVNADGTFNKKEFFYRLTSAGIFSAVFGDWAVATINAALPILLVAQYPAAIYLMVGAPAWWITRLVATTLRLREGKDGKEVWKEIKDL